MDALFLHVEQARCVGQIELLSSASTKSGHEPKTTPFSNHMYKGDKEHALDTEILLLVLGMFAPGVYLAYQRQN